MPVIPHPVLQEWIAAVLARLDVPAEDAEVAAATIVRTSLRGIDTHGVALFPHYVKLLRNGDARARPDVRFERRGIVHAVEAGFGLGQVVGPRVLRRLCEDAKTAGLAAATLRDVGHLGALGMFALAAAESGLVALVLQNSQPLMALPGASGRMIGNNPLALGAPLPGRDPLVVDMAASEAALGKIMNAAQAGRPIPGTWALDRGGQPTTDAAAAVSGMLLPAAGAKGLGLAMLVEVLAGSLSGSVPQATMREGQIPHGFGAFMLVIDPAIVAGRNAFDRHMSDWLGHYLTAAPTARYPGLRSAECERDRLATGIPLDDALQATLREIGAAAGVPLSAPV